MSTWKYQTTFFYKCMWWNEIRFKKKQLTFMLVVYKFSFMYDYKFKERKDYHFEERNWIKSKMQYITHIGLLQYYYSSILDIACSDLIFVKPTLRVTGCSIMSYLENETTARSVIRNTSRKWKNKLLLFLSELKNKKIC